MILVFSRTGERRYTVEAQRPGLPHLLMNPAPGYDPLMPHDMMHMVVEAQLGLRNGIFGQLAAGGNAGTFHVPMKNGDSSRQIARTRRRVAARGKKLLRGGRDECLQSERAAFICWQEWRARSSSRDRGKLSGALNQGKLDEICEHLDELSSHWFRLTVGQSMSVSWPDLAIESTSDAPPRSSAEGKHQRHDANTPQQKLNDHNQ